MSPSTPLMRVPSDPATFHRLGLILLAAGSSSRMGQPKQLLPFQGRPLIVRAVEACLASEAWPTVVVLGAHGAAVRPLLSRHPVLLADNPAWEEGMASSLRAGLTTLQCFSQAIDAVLVALCDQPGFGADTIAALIARQRETGAGIAAARYHQRLGAPALFTARYFAVLAGLSGDEGARHVISAAALAGDVAEVDLPALALDLDTPADYQRALLSP